MMSKISHGMLLLPLFFWAPIETEDCRADYWHDHQLGGDGVSWSVFCGPRGFWVGWRAVTLHVARITDATTAG